MFLCTTPRPPSCAMAMARPASVTVSIAADSSGIFSEMVLVRRVWRLTSRGTTEEWAGSSRTSSKVRAFWTTRILPFLLCAKADYTRLVTPGKRLERPLERLPVDAGEKMALPCADSRFAEIGDESAKTSVGGLLRCRDGADCGDRRGSPVQVDRREWPRRLWGPAAGERQGGARQSRPRTRGS